MAFFLCQTLPENYAYISKKLYLEINTKSFAKEVKTICTVMMSSSNYFDPVTPDEKLLDSIMVYALVKQ